VFRKAAQGIVAYACAIPSEELDDELAREAYRSIGKLVKQVSILFPPTGSYLVRLADG
jgi:hypothetical protein